jgi:tRNA threonylcarbamoyladenosine biosynthesis protein TsaB
LPPDPLILAFDTSAASCAAALLSGVDILETRVDEMARGQAEHLMPMLEAMLKKHGVGWGDLAAIGVGTGPGNFTGIRISVSAARGLALALGIPAVGISGFEAMAPERKPGVRAVIPAPRGMVYTRRTEKSGAQVQHLPESALSDLEGAVLWQSEVPVRDRVLNIARLAHLRRDMDLPRPVPLYIRAADAAPSSLTPPVILR